MSWIHWLPASHLHVDSWDTVMLRLLSTTFKRWRDLNCSTVQNNLLLLWLRLEQIVETFSQELSMDLLLHYYLETSIKWKQVAGNSNACLYFFYLQISKWSSKSETTLSMIFTFVTIKRIAFINNAMIVIHKECTLPSEAKVWDVDKKGWSINVLFTVLNVVSIEISMRARNMYP